MSKLLLWLVLCENSVAEFLNMIRDFGRLNRTNSAVKSTAVHSRPVFGECNIFLKMTIIFMRADN